MKKILFTSLLTVLFSVALFSQPWLTNLPENKTKSEITFFDYQNAFNEYWKNYDIVNGWYFDENGEKQKAYGWKQFKRWENFWHPRVNPQTGEFPKTDAATEYKKYVAENGNYKSDMGNWTCLGTSTSPGGYAGIGRINTVAFHPTNTDVFWIGAPAGGLWGTVDGGNTWTVTTDNNDVLGVSGIVIPSDYDVSNTIYIGTGDRDAQDNYSVGVLKSSDNGTTWESTGLTFNPADMELVNQLRLHPETDNTIFAATSDGLYVTYNAGDTWDKKFDYEFVDFELCPNFPDTLYGSTRAGKIYRSVDAGENWSLVYNSGGGARVELAVTADNPMVVYAIGANSGNGLYAIFKSTDYGENFDIVFDDYNMLGWSSTGGDSGGQGWYDLAMAADPNNEDIVYIGGVNTWRSVDGGVTWDIVNHWTGTGAAAVHADKHYLVYRNDESVLFEGNDGGIYSTTDGNNWAHHTNGIAISQIYGLSTAQTVESMTILGLQDNGTKLQDNTNWYDVLGGDGMKCLIDYTDEETQYGSYYYGEIYRTFDGWSSNYSNITNNIPGGANGAWVTPYVLDPINPGTIYVGYGTLWKSTNYGNDFESIGTFGGKLNSIAVCPTNNNYIYVGKSNYIQKTTNGGTTWESVNNNLPLSSSSLTYIEVKYDDPNTVWVTLSGYDENTVYETTDGGDTWTNISSGLPNIPANCIIQNKLETSQVQLYVGTDYGIYLKNGTEDWILFSNGLPNVVVTELDIYYDLETPENSRLRASTYGRGLWESDLNLSGNYAPFMNTVTATDIDTSSANLTGEILNDFSSNVIESGILVSQTNNPLVGGDDVIQIQTNPVVTSGEFTLLVEDLTPGTTYFYRAYSENENGIGYGGNKNFVTLCTDVKSFPWTSGVENDGNIPNCFENLTVSGEYLWEARYGGNSGIPNAPYLGDFNFYIIGSSSNSGSTKLVLPPFDLSQRTATSVGFWLFKQNLFSFSDNLIIYAKSENDNDWEQLDVIEDEYTEWTYFEVNLPNLTANYQVALEAELNGGRGIAIDELYVGDPLLIGIEENNNAKISVFPNPTSGVFTISINNDVDLTNAKIEISDVTGKKIYTYSDFKTEDLINFNVDLSDYANGIYIIKLMSEKQSFTTKIIKQ